MCDRHVGFRLVSSALRNPQESPVAVELRLRLVRRRKGRSVRPPRPSSSSAALWLEAGPWLMQELKGFYQECKQLKSI